MKINDKKKKNNKEQQWGKLADVLHKVFVLYQNQILTDKKVKKKKKKNWRQALKTREKLQQKHHHF